jgi:O-antigen/teichoic acid export membrane protein
MLVNNVLIFLSHRSTDLVIGRITGAPALGLYNIAYEISNLPTTELVFPISRAVFPGYAKMAASLEDLRQGFLDVLSVIVLFAVPAGLGIMVVSEPLPQVGAIVSASKVRASCLHGG